MLDAEHILGILMMLIPLESPSFLADEADVIAETAVTRSEAAAFIALIAVESPWPWYANQDRRCFEDPSARRCSASFSAAWRASRRVCGESVERRFAYWNTGVCATVNAVTRRQARVWQAAMVDL